MEAAPVAGGGIASSSSLAGRKQWRAMPENAFRTNVAEAGEQVKQGHSDERTIYEDETGPLDADFCSILIDGELNNDILQRRLEEIVRQREELQNMEIGMRAQIIVQSGLSELQSNYEAQLKEHVGATTKLKEQLQEREKQILELELKLEEKDRELRAMKIDTEAAWAKEDLLREQNKELATFRRERDNSEAERMQHLNQIGDMQDHIREKENQFLALEEQHRAAQETILFKDEQLREAQAWITRVQEIDALQSSTNQSLQAELRERTEQFNQYWLSSQRQFAEMEHHHMQAIQQLQLELAKAREKSDLQKEDSQPNQENQTDASSYIHSKGNQNSSSDAKANGTLTFTSNGNLDGASSNGTTASSKTEHSHGVAVVPSPMLGMSAFLPPGQVTALHPYLLNPQNVAQAVASTNPHIPQVHMGHLQPMSAITTHQNWLGQQVPIQSKYPTSLTDHELPKPDAQYTFNYSAERQSLHHDQLTAHGNQHQRYVAARDGISQEVQEPESNGKHLTVSQESQVALKANIHLNSTSEFGSSEKETKECNKAASNNPQEFEMKPEQQWPNSSGIKLSQNHSVSSDVSTESNEDLVNFPDVPVSSQISHTFVSGKSTEPKLLDERSLLACIVRAIPAGADSKIRISTTLPNRLGKMLAPLHWHDYKKRYGKLDDFVSHHPELFVIQGDFIHLREGAQQIISATTAIAKVAAAAASSAPYASLLPSVAVTPVAQVNRLKKVQAVDIKAGNTVSSLDSSIASNTGSESLQRQELQKNGVDFNVIQGFTDISVSSKLKNNQEANQSSEMKPGYSSVHLAVRNSTNLGRTSSSSAQNKAMPNGNHSYVGKQQRRSSGAGLNSRR